MTVNSSILKIGNSCGIIIPAKILKALSLSEKDSVRITETGGRITIQKLESSEVETPFSALDSWCDERGYASEESLEDALEYVERIRAERNSKEIIRW